MVKIMIADDHPLFIEGLTNLLQAQDFIEVVNAVNNGQRAVEEALKNKPDVILMDIGMPVLNGIEATRQIKKELPEVRIIILTSFEEEDNLFKAIKAGASGYLIKSLDGEELIRSLSDLQEGKNPFSAGLGDCILNKVKRDMSVYEAMSSGSREELTERQLDVIKLLVKGLTYNEIGEELFVSERTIKYHMEQIKKKLSLKTQAQVISYAKNYLLKRNDH